MKDSAPAGPGGVRPHPSGRRHELLEVLMELQERNGFVSEAGMRAAAAELNVPLPEVYRAATFYKAFALKPRGRHTLTVCMGTACHVRSAALLLDQLEGLLGVGAGNTTADGMFTLERVNCLGACALGPILVVDGEYHHHMSPAKARRLVRGIAAKEKETCPK